MAALSSSPNNVIGAAGSVFGGAHQAGAGSPIVVPQPYPVRLTLVDYEDNDEDDDDDDDNVLQAGDASSRTVVVVVPPSESERKLVRTDSVQELSAPATEASSSPSAASPSSPNSGRPSRQFPSVLETGNSHDSLSNSPSTPKSHSIVRQRRGSISVPDSRPNPPLKRRRDEEDEEDMMLSLLGNSKHKRRNSTESIGPSASRATPTPSLGKGKGKELPHAVANSDTGHGITKKIKLSLKAGLGMSSVASSDSTSTPPTSTPVTSQGGVSKDADTG